MKLVRRLLGFGPGRPAPRPVPPADPERLHRIYRDAHQHVANLRRAA